MRAMVFDKPHRDLRLDTQRPVPRPGPREVLIRVHACGVCRTDLHVVDGELTEPKQALIPGHEIVAWVEQLGQAVESLAIGARVGVPWLGWTCGVCPYCMSGRENLCDRARFTGYQIDGGYAEYAVADERYCFPLPAQFGDVAAAPLPLRRADRLSRVAYGGRCEAIGPLWLRRGGAYRGPGRQIPRFRTSMPSPNRGDNRGTGFRENARRGVGRRLGRGAAGTA